MALKLIQGKQINVNLTGSFTGSFTGNLIGSASFSTSASFANNSTSASYSVSSSYAVSSSFASNSTSASYSVTSSFANTATSASYALSSSFAVSSSRSVSSSFSTTASFAQTSSIVQSIANNITNNGDNYVLTATGGDTINGEVNLQFDGNLLKIQGNLEQGSPDVDAQGSDSHAEGRNTTAKGDHSHAEGRDTTATGDYSHAEGQSTDAIGNYSHAEGQTTNAIGNYSHTEGLNTETGIQTAFSTFRVGIIDGLVVLEGNVTNFFTSGGYLYLYNTTFNSGWTSHLIDTVLIRDNTTEIQLLDTNINEDSAYVGDLTYLQSNGTFGGSENLPGPHAHSEGLETKAMGQYSHAEGASSYALGQYSHAEGRNTQAIGKYSHTEGRGSLAVGDYSHAEGQSTQAIGASSHTEGILTKTGTQTAFITRQEVGVGSGLVRLANSYGDVTANFTPGGYLYLYDEPFEGTYGRAIYQIDTVSFDGDKTVIQLVNTGVSTNIALVGDLTYLQNNGTFGGNQIIPTPFAHTEGGSTLTLGEFSHAEGESTQAIGVASHTEGRQTVALGTHSHAEGTGTQAIGNYSHAEGSNSRAIGQYSHAEGQETISSGSYSHAEGYSTISLGSYSHAEGTGTQAIGNYSHAEGESTIAYGDYSHAEGLNTIASGSNSHAEGVSTIAKGSYSHAEGVGAIAYGNWSHAEGDYTIASGSYSHAEGESTIASGSYSHAEGESTRAQGIGAHAEGLSTQAIENYSHAEGNSTIASGTYSHAEGQNTRAIGNFSHAEGDSTTAQGNGSHAEGVVTISVGLNSHAEGLLTSASANYSHAEGQQTQARGEASHTEGLGTVASGPYQHVQGQYNISSSAQSAFIIGNGTADNSRSNLVFAAGNTVQVTGSLRVSGSITGSLFGTASYVINAATASFVTGSNVYGPFGSNSIVSASFAVSSSRAVTSSFALTSSYAINQTISGSINGADYIDFSTNYIIGTNAPAQKEGRLFYDSGSGALAFYNWEQDVTLNIGQEAWLRARNQTGATITNGSVVKLVGAIGDRPTIALAQSSDQTNTFSIDNEIIGMATHDIENGTDGFITTFGTVNGLNTSAYAAGDILWVSQSAGQFTKTAPSAPFDKTFVGIVTRANPSNGAVFVTPLTPIHFHDISSVSASVYQQGDLWMYRSGSAGQANAWINTKQLSGSYGITGSLGQGVAVAATGIGSHAQGNFTTADGPYSHAEGSSTTSTGIASHAEGYNTTATGNYSHAEGDGGNAIGNYSHIEGLATLTLADYSHAAGNNTVASGQYQSVIGQYNISSSAPSAFIVGNGTGTGASRSNLIFASGSQVQITGSVIATQGFTGSLFGTASFATSASQAITASFAPAYLPIAVPQTTGLVISFTQDRVYGTFASPETGSAITSNTASAILGVTNLIIHSASSSPTTGSDFKKLTGSSNYVAGVNYIYCTYIADNQIIYSISQAT